MKSMNDIETVSRSALRSMLIGFGTFVALDVAVFAIAGITGAMVGSVELLVMVLIAIAVPVAITRAARRRREPGEGRKGVWVVPAVIVVLSALLLFGVSRKPTYTSKSILTCYNSDGSTCTITRTGPGALGPCK